MPHSLVFSGETRINLSLAFLSLAFCRSLARDPCSASFDVKPQREQEASVPATKARGPGDKAESATNRADRAMTPAHQRTPRRRAIIGPAGPASVLAEAPVASPAEHNHDAGRVPS
eukprot:3569446-Rhodomonas_salina.1